MSLQKIGIALETRLAAMTPPLATAHENESYTPVNGTPYQRSWLLPARPDNADLGRGHYREQGVFQVSLFYPEGAGAGAVTTRAEAIKAWFPRGATYTKDGVNVGITHTAEIHPGRRDSDRWVVDVSIRWQADIFL